MQQPIRYQTLWTVSCTMYFEATVFTHYAFQYKYGWHLSFNKLIIIALPYKLLHCNILFNWAMFVKLFMSRRIQGVKLIITIPSSNVFLQMIHSHINNLYIKSISYKFTTKQNMVGRHNQHPILIPHSHSQTDSKLKDSWPFVVI